MFFIIVLLPVLIYSHQDASLMKSIEDFILLEEFNSDFKLSRKSLEKINILFPDYVKNSLKESDPVHAVLVVCYYDWDSLFDDNFRRELFKIQDFYGPNRLVILSANIFFTRSFTNYFQVFSSPSILVLSRGSGFHNYREIRNSEFIIPFLNRFLLNETQLVPSFEEELAFRNYLNSEEYVVYQILHLEKDEDEDNEEHDSFWESDYYDDYIDPFVQTAKYHRHVSFCRIIIDSDIMSHQKIFLHTRETKEKLNFRPRSTSYGEEVNVEELIDWVTSHAPILVHDLTRRNFQEFIASEEKQNVLLLFYRDFKIRESSMKTFREVAWNEYDHFHFSFANLNSYEEFLNRLLSHNQPSIHNSALVLIDWKNKEHYECQNCLRSENEEEEDSRIIEVDVEKTIRFLQRYRTSCRSYREEKVNIYEVLRYSGLSISIPQFHFLKNRLSEFLVYFKRKQCLHCEVFEKKVLHRTVYSKFSRRRPKDGEERTLLFVTVDCEVENCHRIEGMNIEFLPYLVYHSGDSYDIYKGTYDYKDLLRWIHNIGSWNAGERKRKKKITLSLEDNFFEL